MTEIVWGLQLTVALVASASLLVLLAQPRKQVLHLLWGLFCGSLAVMMIKQLAGDSLGPYQYLVGLGACATCNAYWLVARALFRPGAAFAPRHLGLAGAIALLVIAGQLLELAAAQGKLEPALHAAAGAGIRELLVLLSSTVLLLTVREGLLGWRQASARERRLRGVFVAAFAGAVIACMVLPGIFDDPQVERLLQAASALFIVLLTNVLVQLRSRSTAAPAEGPRATGAAPSSAPEVKPIPPEDRRLAASVDRAVREGALFLEPQLKVADVARVLDVPEYRVSRVVGSVLGERNFNRYVNRFRIERARDMLSDPGHDGEAILAIALESGFGSVGPFNRAFKESVGMTPSAFRAACRGTERGAAAAGLAKTGSA